MHSFKINACVQQVDYKNCKAVLVASIPYLQLKDVVRQTCMTTNPNNNEYQRRVEPERIKRLKKHIRGVFDEQNKGNARALFPTSIILATDNSLSFSDIKAGESVECELSDGTMIVDGQHRFFGMDALYREMISQIDYEGIMDKIQQYHFSCTILVNYDLWEQANIFVDVNFNQTRVNRSLLYHIYGVILDADSEQNLHISKQNDIYISHAVVEQLQNNEKSVLCGYIKMLGREPGWVSQAFFVEALMKHMRPSGIWGFAPTEYKDKTFLISNIYMEVSSLLACLRSTFSEFWPEEGAKSSQSVLCKTTGLGASIQLLDTLHDSLSDEVKESFRNNKLNLVEIAEIISTFAGMIEILKPYGEELFSLDKDKGKFSGTGGDGLQLKLYKRMRDLLKDKKQ